MHIQTANASHCSCGKLWLDHCETLSIQNEQLLVALKETLGQTGHHGACRQLVRPTAEDVCDCFYGKAQAVIKAVTQKEA